MHPTSQFSAKTAALVAALHLVGTAGAQEARPTPPAAVPQINKTTIYNGPVPTVSYSVQGGSPHLQALIQTLQYTENEINLTGELQNLRRGIVANEQTLDHLRTWQQLGLAPIIPSSYVSCYARPDSALKSALIPGLAREATPATAYALINWREQVQTELLIEQGKAPIIVRGEPPASQNAPGAPGAGPVPAPQPAAPAAAPPPAPAMVPAQAVPQQLSLAQDPVAFQQTVLQNQEQVRQQILQMQQQILQRHQQIRQVHFQR